MFSLFMFKIFYFEIWLIVLFSSNITNKQLLEGVSVSREVWFDIEKFALILCT